MSEMRKTEFLIDRLPIRNALNSRTLNKSSDSNRPQKGFFKTDFAANDVSVFLTLRHGSHTLDDSLPAAKHAD